MSANHWAGEVALTVDGRPLALRLTLGALAELESALGAGSLAEIAARFDGGAVRAADVAAIIRAGLRGGGHEVDLTTAEIEGGPMAAARVAARLLARAFALPES